MAITIQTLAALVFLGSVVFDAIRRGQAREQERRDNILRALLYEWSQISLPPPENAVPKSPAEIGGLISERQVKFFNRRLAEIGERWTVPLSTKVVIPIRFG
jgi:hypothetical protein